MKLIGLIMEFNTLQGKKERITYSLVIISCIF